MQIESLRATDGTGEHRMFVPFSEELLATVQTPLGELVPYQIEYECVRLLDGTLEFNFGSS